MDSSNPQLNMLNQQIRTMNVTDDRVLEAILKTPRHDFVPTAYQALAYADMMIPISYGEYMLSPLVEARMLQALGLTGDEHVLEIGTGTGYFSALLGRLAKSVVSVDIHRDFSDMAALKMIEHKVFNVKFMTGSAAEGWSHGGPFDAIVITGSLPVLPKAFLETLKIGGCVVAIVGDAPSMQVIRVRKTDQGSSMDNLFDTMVPALQGARVLDRFQF
ncbi:MAG: protein-L-isoaspartate O-methyltransferase [Gammaproteobacteria bacterium]|nr:protein-L-isoaspartate O-methyltransferase [Gammaproteobacteria bacterium]